MAMAIAAGINAPKASFRGEMPSGKCFPKICCPAGLGAFAITVIPPAATAPTTTAYLESSGRLGINVAK